MKRYIGTKIVHAEPAAKDGHAGYFVKYPDGYTSWSPKLTFEEAYRESDALTFGLAVEALKMGCKVARSGWNGKGMFLSLVPADAWDFFTELTEEYTDTLPFIAMKTADGKVVPWLASQTDILSEDWSIL